MSSRAQETRYIKSLQTAKTHATRHHAANELAALQTPRAIEALFSAIGDPSISLDYELFTCLSAIPRCRERARVRLQEECARYQGKPLPEADLERISDLLRLGLQQKNTAIIEWAKELYAHPALTTKIAELVSLHQPPGMLDFLIQHLSSQQAQQKVAAVEAALNKPTKEAFALLRPYLFEPGPPIFAYLLGQRPHPDGAQLIEHYKNPSWLEAALTLGRSAPSQQEFVLFLEMLLSLLKPHEAYATIAEVFTPSFMEDKKNKDLALILFGCVFRNFHRHKERAHLTHEHRWLTLYLTFCLHQRDPDREKNLAVIELLGLSPDELLHVLPSSLFVGGPPPHARALFHFLAKRPWLCAAPAWNTHLQSWQARFPAEVAEILSHQEPLSSLTDNTETTPHILQASAKNLNRDIRLSVVKNPNTPFPALFSLAQEFPEEFINNPSLELMLLEDSTFYERLFIERPDQTPLKAILDQPSAPAWLLGLILTRGLFRHGWRMKAIQHANAPQEVLDKIARHPGYESNVRKYAIRRASALDRETLIALLTEEDPVTRAEAAKKPNAPKEIIEGLRRLGSFDIYTYDPTKIDLSLSPEFLTEFAAYGFWAKCLVAQHPNCSAELLLRLSQDPSDGLSEYQKKELRFYVAQHPNLPLSSLKEWASNVSLADASNVQQSLHLGIAKNPNATAEILQTITNNKYSWNSLEHAEVASHPNTSVECLLQLVKGQALVRSNVAKNPNTPHETLRALAKDPDKGVKLSLAENPMITEELLGTLAKEHEADVLISVACHEKTPPEVLLSLAKSTQELRVKNMIVQNENTPSEALQYLWQSKNSSLRKDIQRHPNYVSHP